MNFCCYVNVENTKEARTLTELTIANLVDKVLVSMGGRNYFKDNNTG